MATFGGLYIVIVILGLLIGVMYLVLPFIVDSIRTSNKKILTEIRSAREQFDKQTEKQNKMIFDGIMLVVKTLKDKEAEKKKQNDL